MQKGDVVEQAKTKTIHVVIVFVGACGSWCSCQHLSIKDRKSKSKSKTYNSKNFPVVTNLPACACGRMY
jgi:Ni,Fe-hydrogenase I small subunit